MISYEPELVRLDAPPALIAIERREVFSVHREVRALAWGGAMLAGTGAAILVSKNLDRIGPVTLAAAIAVAAIACYAYSAFSRRTAIHDYVTLLGALLVSVDVAYIESQFHLLDQGWPRHLLILAVLHGIAAYLFDSRMVLTLSIAALASWLGVEQNAEALFDADPAGTGLRAFVACAAVALWRAIDFRFRTSRTFERVFEHAAANLALFGGLLLTIDDRWRLAGLAITLAAAAAVILFGFRRDAEPFAIYAYIYAVVAVDIVIVDALNEDVLITLYLIVSTIAAIAGLFILHGRFRRKA